MSLPSFAQAFPPSPEGAARPLPRPKRSRDSDPGRIARDDGPDTEATLPPKKRRTSPPPAQLPATPSFATRRSQSSRKAAPSALSLYQSPPQQSGGSRLSLQPAIHSAPPIPASRFASHQQQSNPVVANFGSVPTISRTLQSQPPAVRFSQAPKTAGAPASSSVRTTVQPPTPLPPVPPTPSSLRHITHPPPKTATPTLSITHPNPKAAFLAPFEALYESVRAATMHANQARAASASASTGPVMSAGLALAIEEMVERRIQPMRDEMDGLRDRIRTLEDILMLRPANQNGSTNKRSAPANGSNSSTSERALSGRTPSPARSSSSGPPPSLHTRTSSTRLEPSTSSVSSSSKKEKRRMPSPLGRAVNGRERVIKEEREGT